jgi:glycosyltransferase involved in cell wall biosynthesis
LARALAGRGHEVLYLYCSSFISPRGAVEAAMGDPPTLTIDAVDHGEPFDKYHFVHRTRQELRYARRFEARIDAFGADAVLSANTPLFSQRRIGAACRRAGRPMVLWLQDIYSAAMRQATRGRLGALGAPVSRWFTSIERAALRDASAVIVISEDFVPFVSEAGVDADRVTVIENWAPLAELPLVPRDNPWSRAHGLVDDQVLLYSGTLGLKHDPSLLADLARAAERRGRTRVVVVSEGKGADWLHEAAAGGDLPALTLLPYQPHHELPSVLGSADVLLAILEPDAGIYSVPSKVLAYHCAGRPILAALPAANLAARTVASAGSGVVVEPSDREGLVTAAMGLLDDADRRATLGARARSHAETAFDVDQLAPRFEAALGLVGATR